MANFQNIKILWSQSQNCIIKFAHSIRIDNFFCALWDKYSTLLQHAFKKDSCFVTGVLELTQLERENCKSNYLEFKK